MAKKKMSKQDKKKAEAEQAEALRIEMEKQRFETTHSSILCFLSHLMGSRINFIGKSNLNSKENEWY